MKTAEERYEETWNSYLELLNKDPRASLVSFTKLNTATEEPNGKKERPHTNNGTMRKVYYDIETVPQDIQERGEMVPQTCMFPTCEKEVPRLW